MNEVAVTNILIVGYIVEVAFAILAWIGIYRFYREDHGAQSEIWKALMILKALVIGGALITLPIAMLALFGLPRLPYTGAIVVLYVMLQLGTIIVYYLVFRRIRNRRGPDSLR